MRTLALDIGEVRVGLAVSDSAGKIATPLKVLPADVVLNHGAEFRRIVEDWEIERSSYDHGRRRGAAGGIDSRESAKNREGVRLAVVFL